MAADLYRGGPLDEYLAGPSINLSQADEDSPPGQAEVVFAPYLLQDLADYRGALQQWFERVPPGGLLIVTVPHAFLFERQDAAPSRYRAAQRRLYTPRALIEEIEEALVPNSYRLRWLGDLDQGYDYGSDRRLGRYDVGAVLERIAPPPWDLTQPIVARPAPEDLFEPDHTRVERVASATIGKILALKLDHLGDFIMGLAALERLRATFPEAEITLVVGSWNEDLAQGAKLADRVLAFDAFPRNASEEPPDIGGKTALFDALITDRYDLAIDLRTNPDSRFLLRNVQAAIKAGIGVPAHFPFLDIFLPVDPLIDRYDVAWNEEFGPARFRAQEYCTASPFSIACPGERVRQRDEAIIFGPYRSLPPGDYIFEPFIELDRAGAGLLACDIALDTRRVDYEIVSESAMRLAFRNEKHDAQFEFRLFPVEDTPTPDFRFYGGRLSKRGSASGLHQSEYLILLIQLIALRVRETGLFGEGER